MIEMKPGSQEDRRRWPRLCVETDVEFRRRREPHYMIPMYDLTAQGCRIASPLRLQQDEMVWVQLPSLESMSAEVKWAGEFESGVEFERPMHPAVFDMMVARLLPA